MSFVAYILRGSAQLLRAYQSTIPQSIMQLLQNCPSEATATRKELLSATRHILTTEMKTAFVPYINSLLRSEAVLLGTGVTAQQNLRCENEGEIIGEN